MARGAGGRSWTCFLRVVVQYRTLLSHSGIAMGGPNSRIVVHGGNLAAASMTVFSLLFRSDWFLMKQSADCYCRVIGHLLRSVQPSGCFGLPAFLCEACSGSLVLRIRRLLCSVAEKPITET